MFKMKIDRQLNVEDRPFLLGVSRHVVIPKVVEIEGMKYKVLGISYGVRPPFVSLEIEKVIKEMVGYTVTG